MTAATQNDFQHAMKHVGMSQSPTPATRNDIAQRLKPPEATTFAAVAIGTAIVPTASPPQSCRRLRTRTQKQRQANTGPPPEPQDKTRTLRYAFGKKGSSISHQLLSAPPLHVFWHVSRHGGKSPQRPARLGHMGTLRSTLGCPL